MRFLSISSAPLLGQPTWRLFYCFFYLCLFSCSLNAQERVAIRGPNDTTLHGNPDCARWIRLEEASKLNWLSAILNPINMTYLLREKPALDKYGALSSLAPAARFVDDYCRNGAQLQAMAGATQYFEALITRAGQ